MGGGRCLPLMRTYLAAPLQSLSLSTPGHQSADILISIPPSLSLPLLYQFWSSFLPFLLFLPEVKYLCVSSPLHSSSAGEKRLEDARRPLARSPSYSCYLGGIKPGQGGSPLSVKYTRVRDTLGFVGWKVLACIGASRG